MHTDWIRRHGTGGMNPTNNCCAECGEEGGVSLKVCKSCMSVKYCNAACQRNHWPTHKTACKLRAAELHDEALFKDPPPKEECPLCFLPMPSHLICCVSLPPANILSVPIYDFAIAHEELANKSSEEYYACCGKTICRGCEHSFRESGNNNKCPFCNADQCITCKEMTEQLMKRVEANDPTSTYLLANSYHRGFNGFQQDHVMAIELYTRAADLDHSEAHSQLGNIYYKGGDMKKAKFHLEAAAISGHEESRFNIGVMDYNSGNKERAVKHWTIAASAGDHIAMNELRLSFEEGLVSRESIDSTLTAYNYSCAEMRSEARDASIYALAETI